MAVWLGLAEKNKKSNDSLKFIPYIWTMAKGNGLKVVIPVKRHIYQYILHVYKTDVIAMGKHDPMMFAAYCMLLNPVRNIDYYNADKPYPCKITLLISADYNNTGMINLTHHHIGIFNHFIEQFLKVTIFCYLDVATATGLKIKDGIMAFLQRYEIDESEWSYETIKKGYYRYRKADKIKTGVLSPKNPPQKDIDRTGRYHLTHQS